MGRKFAYEIKVVATKRVLRMLRTVRKVDHAARYNLGSKGKTAPPGRYQAGLADNKHGEEAMTRKKLAGAIAVVMFSQLSTATAAVQILPTPLADRTFQFVHISESFLGTPLKVDALTPYALFVLGPEKTPALYVQAATMAYMVGQWSQEPGTSLAMIKTNQNLGPVVLDTDLTPDQIANHNLVVLGKGNQIYPRIAARLTGKGSFVEVLKNGLTPGREVMFVSDEKAAFYLANRRLYFKSGAYKGFFSFVKARTLMERSEFAEALNSLDNPEAVRGCGKPVILALGHKEELPPEMLRVAEERNKLVFNDLRAALTAGNKAKAVEAWEAAMGTCYGCHQGRGGVTQFRKFKPNEGEHGYHSVIATQLETSCQTCHKGMTDMVGYK